MSNVKLKKLVSLILTAAMVLAFVPMSAFAEDDLKKASTEDGTVYYLIYTADDLYKFRDKVNAGETNINAMLMKNISLNNIVFDPANPFNAPLNADELTTFVKMQNDFFGIFDGNGHTINGIYNESLFKDIINTGIVKNLSIDYSYIKTSDRGIIASTISNSDNSSFGANLANIYIGNNVYATVSGNNAGAVVGFSTSAAIAENIYSYANTNNNTGTIIGLNVSSANYMFSPNSIYKFNNNSPSYTDVNEMIEATKDLKTMSYTLSADKTTLVGTEVSAAAKLASNSKLMPTFIADALLIEWNGQEGSITSEVSLSVTPITELDVDVPIAISFVIDSDRNIHLPEDVKIVSRSKTPLDVSLKASSNDINLVAANTFDDDEWDNLGQADTTSYFALKINSVAPPTLNKDLEGNVSFAADNETHEYEMLSTDVDAHDLGMLRFYDAAASEIGLGFAAKYGKAWGNSNNIELAINLMFTLGTPE